MNEMANMIHGYKVRSSLTGLSSIFSPNDILQNRSCVSSLSFSSVPSIPIHPTNSVSLAFLDFLGFYLDGGALVVTWPVHQSTNESATH